MERGRSRAQTLTPPFIPPRPDDQPEQSYSERQIFEAASSRLARELAAMEKTDEKAALQKILAILNEAAPQYYEKAE